MKYALVTTTRHLLLVDLERRSVVPLENERPEYYGISWFAGSPELVLSHSGLDNETLRDLAGYARSEVGWVSQGARDSRKCLSAPHQILCAPDGRIICTNTGRNVVSVLDPLQPNRFQEAGLSAQRWDRLSPEEAFGDHLNSVFLQDDRLHVIAHRHARGSLLGSFSYPDLELLAVEPLGERSGLHNIWITAEGQRISCHSEAGSLIDLDARAPLWQSGSPMYSRGLAACADYVVVGESQKGSRQDRRASSSGLWILDRHDWKAIDYLCLGPYGAVHEVRLLDMLDEAHHGQPFAGLADLLVRESCAERLSRQRLKSADSEYRARQRWAAFETVFGSPSPNGDGWRTATCDDLCLAMKAQRNEPAEMAVAFELLAPLDQSHVSIILDYRGAGGDTDMTALLLHPRDDHQATLTLWRHDGTTWRQDGPLLRDHLPLAGTLHARQLDASLSLSCDGEEMVRLPLVELGLADAIERFGIRWLGASVKPLANDHA